MLSLAEEMQGQDLLRRLNQHAPTGMRFGQARPSLTRRTPRPRRISYQLDLDESKLCRVRDKLEQVAPKPSWPIQRVKSPEKRHQRPRTRSVDLKVLVESIELQGDTLRWTGRPQGDLWARPVEVLALVGLDDPGELAGVVRTAVEYDT